jgi:hypothetical protein
MLSVKQVANKTMFIFSTSESDTMTITKDDNGNYFERRYGLPCFPLTIDQLKTIAWFECNRRGYFKHLLYYVEGDNLPKLSNPDAQEFIVNQFAKI